MTATTALTMTQVANLLPPLPQKVERKWRQALQIFQADDGRSHGDIFTATQVQIVDLIAKRRFPRTQLILPTQYGKSLAVADGVLLRVSSFKENWAIVAPSEDKARIIMDYIIDRIFDDEIFSSQLEYHGSKEKLKQERSKTRITFRDGGEVRVYSGNASNTKATKSALMGFGAPNIILDEAGQISDELYSTVKRMVGGSEGTPGGTFLLEIGNPVFRNHFMRTWFGTRYRKIFIDIYKALEEGRYSQDFINEMRDEVGFEWMYECIFPAAEEVLPDGYRRLLSDDAVDSAFINGEPHWSYKLKGDGTVMVNKWGFKVIDDKPRLGIDPAGGGTNKTKFVIRFPKHGVAFVAATSSSNDLEELADIAVKLIKRWSIDDYHIAIDAGGVGHGLPSIMRKRGYLVRAVLFGDKHLYTSTGDKVFEIPRTFLNMRAWMYWESRKWLTDGGKLIRDDGFNEMKLINYKQTPSLKTQIEAKEALTKRETAAGNKIESPDTADAFVLTFVDTGNIVDEDDILAV